MPLRGFCSFPLLVLLMCSGMYADEAVDRRGRRHQGAFSGGHFVVQPTRQKLALTDLRSITLESHATPLAKVPPSFRLHLRTGEQIAGQLIGYDRDKIEFDASFGGKRVFRRDTVVGIEQPDGFRRVLAESFDAGLRSWEVQGAPDVREDKTQAGAKNLFFDRIGQSVERRWKPTFDTGRVSVCFHDERGAASLGWQLEVCLDAKVPAWLECFRTEETEYATPTTWLRRQPLPRRAGKHLVQVDFAGPRCRVFFDDHLLGEFINDSSLRPSGVRLKSICGKPGALRFDRVEAALHDKPLRRFEANADADVLFLPGDAEYFGTLESANEHDIVFATKRGKQSLSWNQVQGFAFQGASRSNIPPGVDVRFRPGPGVSPDRLFGTVAQFSDDELVFSHPVWGEVRLERHRLDRLLFSDKN